MKVSDAANGIEKIRIINEIKKMLLLLSEHPRLKELKEREIQLSYISQTEQKIRHSKFREIILGEIRRRYCSAFITLILTAKGIKKKTISHTYGYTCPWEFLGRIYGYPLRRKNEEEKVLQETVTEDQFPIVAKQFNLNTDNLQTILKRLKTN